MIAWFYSVARFLTVVTTSHQKFSEGTKTIAGTSNRFMVVRDDVVVCDDFMQYVMSLDTEQLPSRLAAPSQAPRRQQMVIEKQNFTVGFCDFVTGSTTRC